MDRPPPGTLAVCPVCYWQDAAPGQPSHNPLSLWRSQQNFDLYGANHHQWLDRTRGPLPHEQRPQGWRPIDPFARMAAEREEVIDLIAAAFDGVERGNGITLHEADVIDGYGNPEQQEAARLLDTDERWQEVPWADLDYLIALSYLDAESFPYYLPAYMTWDLRHMDRPDSSTKSRLPSRLADLHFDFEFKRLWGLDDKQKHGVYRYLRFIADYACDFDARDAGNCLNGYWRRFHSAT